MVEEGTGDGRHEARDYFESMDGCEWIDAYLRTRETHVLISSLLINRLLPARLATILYTLFAQPLIPSIQPTYIYYIRGSADTFEYRNRSADITDIILRYEMDWDCYQGAVEK